MSAVIVVRSGEARMFYTGTRDRDGDRVLVGADDPRVLRYWNEACAGNDWRRLRAALPASVVVAVEESP